MTDKDKTRITKSNTEWKEQLTPMQFSVLRHGATEPPFTGAYVRTEEPGMYLCTACGNALFAAETKFDSGTGWPSFHTPASSESIEMARDASLGMERAEVRCARCGSHLGHVFDDGPKPTGKRYCINSVALSLHKTKL